MKKNITVCILILALLGIACKKSDPADTAEDPVTTIIEYDPNGGSILADVTPAHDTATHLRFYCLRSVNGTPEKLTAISIKKQDTVANYILDERERVKYVYGSVNGALINRFMKIDYLADSTISISTFLYKWDQGNATYESTEVYRNEANTWRSVALRVDNVDSNVVRNVVSFIIAHSAGIYFCGKVTLIGLFLAAETGGLAVPIVHGLIVSCWGDMMTEIAKADTHVSNDLPPNTFTDPEIRRNEIANQSFGNKSIVKFTFTGIECSGITTGEVTGEFTVIDQRNTIYDPYYVLAYDCSSGTPVSITLTCSGVTVKKTAPACQ